MKELGSADYLIQALDGVIDPMWFPSLVFILIAGIAFATECVFWNDGHTDASCTTTGCTVGVPVSKSHLAVTAVLVVPPGDHCSPISDTTVLSSVGTGCDHMSTFGRNCHMLSSLV